MGAHFPEVTTEVLHVIKSITDASLKIPEGMNLGIHPAGGVLDAVTAYIGSSVALGTAALTVGPGISPKPAPISIFSKGQNNHVGVYSIQGHVDITGTGLTVKAAKSIFTGGTWKYAGSSFTVAGNVTMSGKTGAIGFADTTISGKSIQIASPTLSLNGRNWQQVVAAVDINSGKKFFDIKHPSKENWRLRYVCLEGPTADVYVKGKLRNESVIHLPDYWKDLVDIETITVSITPIGNYQELYVKKVESETCVIIANQAGSSVNCDYVVFGERKDTTRNISEYEGQTPKEYPEKNPDVFVIQDSDINLETVDASSIWSN